MTNSTSDYPGVSFTITLTESLAEDIRTRAQFRRVTPEEWISRYVADTLRQKKARIQHAQRYHEEQIEEIRREKAAADAPNSPIPGLLKRRLAVLLKHRERAESRLYDCKHSVELTAEKKKEFDSEMQKHEETIKKYLDAIIEYSNDKDLLDQLSKAVEDLDRAKYMYSLLVPQYEDALGQFLAQKAELTKIESQIQVMQTEYASLLKVAELREAEEKRAAETREQKKETAEESAEETAEQEGEMK